MLYTEDNCTFVAIGWCCLLKITSYLWLLIVSTEDSCTSFTIGQWCVLKYFFGYCCLLKNKESCIFMTRLNEVPYFNLSNVYVHLPTDALSDTMSGKGGWDRVRQRYANLPKALAECSKEVRISVQWNDVDMKDQLTWKNMGKMAGNFGFGGTFYVVDTEIHKKCWEILPSWMEIWLSL